MRYYSHTYLPTRALLNSFFHSDKKSYSCYNINNINRMKVMAYKDLDKQKIFILNALRKMKLLKHNETNQKNKNKSSFIWN